MSFTPSTLYYASAAINLLTIPKHFLVGQQHVSKAIDAIPSTPQHVRGKSIAFTTWEYAMGALFVTATLNYKWGKTGGPRSFEDKVALWAITATGTVVGWTYYQVGMYVGLGCLWVAPWLSVAALVWSSR
ncbi:hypothetical protein HBI24_000590 [Parastagonospora nodorum]|nr:hypothetical protein HBH51_053250 [Parastagonospora nodorum]KAH3980442.1 hypothetical protein HBH52_089390 [Parastagonospora nodorum]KAH4180156.1 hypothetical protein HBH43_000340 [Parastagonospora nodorum]KAH4294478.1 hypothetical protein HBI02_181150 [Parastagonospora nodorum]KAH4306765.1 hypothetical protein HBI01_048450 [Parastagonospora nodorum]